MIRAIIMQSARFYRKTPQIVPPKASLSDVIVAINKNTAELSARIDKNTARIDKNTAELSAQLSELRKQFGGYQKKESLSLEEEVGKAIVNYYGDSAECAEATLGFNVLYGKQKGELDIVVELKDDCCAVAEVKKSVGLDAIDQLQKNAELFQLMTLRKTTLLIGGTHFESGVIDEAFKRGIAIVETSGGRFQVVTADESPRRLKMAQQM